MRKSQTATEYLIILAIIIVIALIVVSILGGIPSIGSGAVNNAQLAEAKTLPIGIENIAYTIGGVHSVIRNNLPDSATIMNITLDGKIASFNEVVYPFVLKVGQQKKLSGYIASMDGAVDYVINYKTPNNAFYSQNFTFNYRLPETDITEGLVGYWSFDDYNSTHVRDQSSSNLDGTIQNSLISSEGFFGKALECDGDADYINLNSYIFDFNNGFTVSAWFNIETLPSGDWAQDVLINGWKDSDDSYSLAIQRGGSDEWRLTLMNEYGGSVFASYGDLLTDPVYYHDWAYGLFRWNTTHQSLYLNGEIVDEDSTDGNVFTSDMGIYYIGSSGSTAFNGSIDEIMVWTRALSDDEIEQLYEMGR